MTFLIFYIFTILSSLEQVPCLVGRTWEFLEDLPNSKVVLVTQGSMTTTSKATTAAINLPAACYEVSYVRVEVDNPDSAPVVSYDGTRRIVRIAYEEIQNSQSEYKIYVKAVRNCGSGPKEKEKLFFKEAAVFFIIEKTDKILQKNGIDVKKKALNAAKKSGKKAWKYLKNKFG